jgi:hypothetical protein
MNTLENIRLPKDDPLLIKAVASFQALELTHVDSMTINSFFFAWGLGKSDLSQYSDYYQAVIAQEEQAKNLPRDLIPSPKASSDEIEAGEVTPKQVLVCDYCLKFFDDTEQNISFHSDNSVSDTYITELMAECKHKAKAYADSLNVDYLLIFLGYCYSSVSPSESFHDYQDDDEVAA